MKFVVSAVIGCLALPKLVSGLYSVVMYWDENFGCTKICWVVTEMHEGLCYSWSDLNIDNGFKISSIKPDLGVVCRIWRDSLHCGRDSDPGSNGVSDPFDGTNGLPRLGDLSKYGYYIGSIRCDKA